MGNSVMQICCLNRTAVIRGETDLSTLRPFGRTQGPFECYEKYALEFPIICFAFNNFFWHCIFVKIQRCGFAALGEAVRNS